MGQSPSSSLDATIDTVQHEFRKHSKVFGEMSSLDYGDFLKCILELNEMSRKCIDSTQHQLVFALKKGTDTTIFWKATVRIACVKVRLQPRRIEQYRLLNLKQFLSVFRTFETHINALIRSEDSGCHTTTNTTSSMLIDTVQAIAEATANNSTNGDANNDPASEECIICMDRSSEVLLPCAHSFCCPCIEQWKVQHSSCPVCQEQIDDDNDWVLSETPNADEINEQICTELIRLSNATNGGGNGSSGSQQVNTTTTTN